MILISPWAAKTHKGEPSPKNFPHWEAVARGLTAKGYEVHQLSRSNEPEVPGCTLRLNDTPLRAIESMVRACQTWASVDNFFHHLAWGIKEPGVVIFNKSDPEIFGHAENTNLLKDRRFLRIHQFRWWHYEAPYPESFVGPDVVLEAIERSIRLRGR